VLSRLFGLRAKAAPRAAAAVSEGQRLYVIGDIHGRLDLLDRIARDIAADVATGARHQPLAVLLGDYIDRGPDSAGVLARLSAREFPVPFVALRGNHEQMLLDFLEDERCLESWRLFGGLETLHSFGIDVNKARQVSGFAEAQRHLKAVLPPKMLKFLRATISSYQLGDYYFCHAGIRPGVALDAQRDEDLLWIREEFVQSMADHGKIIVHGHTPVDQPDIRENRINIDTGAYATGKLTCLVLEGSTSRFITT
jgi:serine/threonine protein phosphatase 1